MGEYVVNEMRTFFKPTEEELKQLAAGGYIVFVQLSGQMVPHCGEVFYPKPAEVAGPKCVRVICDKSDPQEFPWSDEFTPNLGNIGLSSRLELMASKISIVYYDGSEMVLKDRNGQPGFVRAEPQQEGCGK